MARGQLPRTDTRRTHPTGARGNRGWGRGGEKAHRTGESARQARLPELLRPGKAQNAGPTKSALLWRTRKLEPHATQGPLHIEQPGA